MADGGAVVELASPPCSALKADARRVKASLESLREASENNVRQCQRSSEVFRERIAGAEDRAHQLALETKDRRERLLELQRLCRSLQGEVASEVARTRERRACLMGDPPCIPSIQASKANNASLLQAEEQGANNVPVIGEEQELAELAEPLQAEASAASAPPAVQAEAQGVGEPTCPPIMGSEEGPVELVQRATEEVKVQPPAGSADEVDQEGKHDPGAELREGARERERANDESGAKHQDEAATQDGTAVATSSTKGKKEVPQHDKAKGKVTAKGKKEPQQDKEAGVSSKKPREEKEAAPQERTAAGAKGGAKGKKESAQDKARRLADEKAKKLADEKAKKQADERSRKESDRRAKQEAEERAKQEAEKARQEAAAEKEKANQEAEKERARLEVEDERVRHEEATQSSKATEQASAGHGKFEELLESEEFEEPENLPQPHEQLQVQEEEEDFGDAQEGEEVKAASMEPSAQERGWFSWFRGR